MKNILKYFLVLVIFPGIILSSCKKSDDGDAEPQESSFTILKDYMITNNMDLTDLLADWVIAPGLTSEGGIVDPSDHSIPGYNVIDIRTKDAFDAGHIKGAIRTDLGNILETAEGLSDKPILVACVTGQTAGHAVMALRLSGYSDAKVLKFGMCGWNSDLAAAWESNIGNTAVGNANWVTDEAPALESYNYPQWTSSSTDGAAILTDRVATMLSNGFNAIASSEILADPSQGQVINFWGIDDYINIGHYEGAYQLKPISLAGDEVSAIDPSETSYIYCYTGQTSSMVTAWLNVLGFNAKSIKFGVNSLSFDALEAAGKPTWHGSADYDYITE